MRPTLNSCELGVATSQIRSRAGRRRPNGTAAQDRPDRSSANPARFPPMAIGTGSTAIYRNAHLIHHAARYQMILKLVANRAPFRGEFGCTNNG